MKSKKMFFCIGIFCIVLSVFTWGLILLLPQFNLSKTQNISIITALVVLGELLFWGGSVLVGKELVEKYKTKLNPKNWFNKNNTDSSNKRYPYASK